MWLPRSRLARGAIGRLGRVVPARLPRISRSLSAFAPSGTVVPEALPPQSSPLPNFPRNIVPNYAANPPVTRITTLDNGLRVASESIASPWSCVAGSYRLTPSFPGLWRIDMVHVVSMRPDRRSLPFLRQFSSMSDQDMNTE